MNEYKCKICDKVFNNYTGLCRHSSRIHNIDGTRFYVEFYLNGVWPICKCGCNEEVKWSKQLKKFRDFIAGHQSRIHNNWGHNKIAIEKSAQTRRQQYADGERKVWNDGLTKEIDDRVRNNVDILTAFCRTDEERKIRSNRMKQCRLNGTVPTLFGPQSSQWKGGISEINNIARSNKRLYEEWKYPILCRDGFKCIECGNDDKLHVHHNKEPMCEIVKKHIVDDVIMDFELKKCIADKIVDYHIQNNVSGVTLCGKCHEKYHPSLNFD